MDTPAYQRARRLALLTVGGALVVFVATLYAALWAPGTLDLSIARETPRSGIIVWVAPNGPAWSAGVVPGDTVSARLPRGGPPLPIHLVIEHGHRRIILGPVATWVDPLDLPVAGLGLVVLLCGAFVLATGRDRRAAAAFWRMTTPIGLALESVPAGFHGALWAIVLTFVGLALFGPALLALTLVFPSPEAPPRRWPLAWAPAVAVLLFYLPCWWRPAPLFALVAAANDALLAGYIFAACARLVWVLRHPCSATQRAQLHWLAVGLACGFLPLASFDLVPHLLTGGELVPPQVSILALALLPLCIGAAIVRTEFLGITALIHRRPLHALVCGALATLVAVAVLGALTEAHGWGWPALETATGVGAVAAFGALLLRPTLTRRAERLLLADAYDPADVTLRVSASLAQAAPPTVGPLALTHLVTIFDLEFALLLTDRDPNPHTHMHTRNFVPAAALETITRRAQAVLGTPSVVQPIMDIVASVPVLLLPLGDGQRVRAVLCCGPKHCGDRYTHEDRALLHALGHYLAVRLQLQTQLDEQATRLHGVQEASVPTIEATAAVGEPLTRSELRILILLAQGLSNKDIAERLDRDTTTIEKHLKSMRRRLGAHAIPNLVAVARQRGLLPSA